jgi:AraC-like DNA-binding protein
MTHKGELLTDKGLQLAVYCYDAATLSNPENAPSIAMEGNFQMVFVLKGGLNCSFGTTAAPFLTLENQQHNLIAVHPQISFTPTIEDDTIEIMVINLSSTFLKRHLAVKHPGYKNLFKSPVDDPGVFCKHNFHITPEISNILYSINNSPYSGFSNQLFLKSKVLELLVLQISQFEQLENDDLSTRLKKSDLQKMQEVKEILVNNLENPLSLRTLAHMVGTNEFNLKKNFKVSFGTTVYGYLTQYKMEQAKMMLIQGEEKIGEISRKMGYKHATHFSSAFKKYFGYLPNKIKIWLFIGYADIFGILFNL